jgi:hypothetical protein
MKWRNYFDVILELETLALAVSMGFFMLNDELGLPVVATAIVAMAHACIYGWLVLRLLAQWVFERIMDK